MTDAITATRRQMKEMADGTCRVYFDIDMQYKNQFLTNFPIDCGVAIALLATGSYIEPIKNENEHQDIAKGGFLSKWLAIRCGEPNFWRFLESAIGINEYVINGEVSCNVWVKEYLDIKSKREIDNNKEIEARFHSMIRLPYAEYLRGVR